MGAWALDETLARREGEDDENMEPRWECALWALAVREDTYI